MALRIQLLNEILGPLVIDVNDPIGINEVVLNIKRSEDYEGVAYDIALDFEFVEEGRAYIATAFETAGGPDAEVFVNVFEWDPNEYIWKIFTSGQISYNKYDLSEDKVVVNIDQTGFQRRTLNLLELDVNLETTISQNGNPLPPNTGVHTDVLYHSKAILKELAAKPSDSSEFQQINVLGEGYPTCVTPGGCTRGFDQTAYGQVDFGDQSLSELDEIFTLPFGYSRDGAFPIYQAKESGTMQLNVSLRLKHSVEAIIEGGDIDFCGSDSNIPHKHVRAWFKHTDSEDNVKDEYSFGLWSSNEGCGGAGAVGEFETHSYTDNDLVIDIGDKIYIYFTWELFGDYTQNNGGASGRVDYTFKVQADLADTWITMVQKTEFVETTAKTVMIYEAIERCAQFITNQVDCFRSNLLGRTDILGPDGAPLYAQDGAYALIGITNGNSLRGRDKPIFANLKDLIDFVNSIACVGFGFETVDGSQILRLERREYFYNKNQKILTLKGVSDIRRRINTKRLYNQIEYGYAGKLDIGSVNAIDEINTLRRESIPVINTKNQLKVSTTMRVSGYQIEFQRRLIGKTTESKLDDENFACVLIRQAGTYRSKKTQGYSEITGVFDPESGYNYDISPARVYKNWHQIVATSLIRSFDKVTKFAYGEVNYTATTRKSSETAPLAEDGDVDISGIEPIFDYIDYSFSHSITRDELQLIRSMPFGYVEVEDVFGFVIEGFISPKGIEFNKGDDEGKADFDLIKVYRKPQ